MAAPRTHPRDQLRAIVAERGEALNDLSKMLGRHRGYLSQFVNSPTLRELAPDDIAVLADYLAIPRSWLGGVDEPPRARRPR